MGIIPFLDATVTTSTQLLSILTDHPVISYFFILAVLTSDVFIFKTIFGLSNGGVGTLITQVFRFFGIMINVPTEAMLFVVAVVPIALYCMKN